MPNLNTSILGDLPISVPHVRVQRAIAEVLGALDDKIAANVRLARVSEDLLRSLFVGAGMSREPQAMDPQLMLSDIVELNPSGLKISNPLPVYLDMQRLPVGSMSIRSWDRRVPQGGARFQNGDTLLARITPCLENGKTGLVDFLPDDEVALGSTEYIVMRPRGSRSAALPYFIATDPRFRSYAIQHMVGTSGRQRVNARDLAGFPMVVSPDFDRFEDLAIKLLPVLTAARDEDNILTNLRDTLLPELMSGRLRVKDAEQQVEDVV